METWDLIEHYAKELVAVVVLTLGGGTTGGFFGKKWRDKEQDKQIKALTEGLANHLSDYTAHLDSYNEFTQEVTIKHMNIANSLENNTKWDKQFRNEVAEKFREIKELNTELKKGQTDLTKQLIELIKSIR